MEKRIAQAAATTVIWLIAVGYVWLMAMIFNPRITSGTVWFIAALFGSIDSQLFQIKEKR